MKGKRKLRRCSFLLMLSLAVCSLQGAFASNQAYADKKANVKLTQHKVKMYAGKTKTIKLNGSKPSKVKWKSTEPKIASVKSGKVKAKTSGKCYIVATYNGKSYRCEVRVTEKTPKDKQTASPDPAAANPSSVPEQTPVAPSSEPEGKSQWEDKIDFVVSKYDPQTMTLSMTIKNHSGSMVNMGEEITIKKYENGNLVEIPRKSNEFRAIAMIVQDGSKVDFDQSIGTNYEPLTAGKYIAFKNVYGVGTVSAEFTVE